MVRLGEIREDLREKNLHDTEDPLLKRADPGVQLDPAVRNSRSTDGTNNDLLYPGDGIGRPPLRPQRPARARRPRHGEPDDAEPAGGEPRADDPRTVSAGDDPQSARGVVDSVPGARLVRAQALEDAARRNPAGARRQLGRADDARAAHRARSGAAGIEAAAGLRQSEQPLVGLLAALRLRCRHREASADDDRRQAEDRADRPAAGRSGQTGISISGFTDNWWIGLAMLHTLFTLGAQPHLRSARRRSIPNWNDDQLFAKARLINTALVAKIHTVEWTPAIMPHPIIKTGMNTNWYGLLEGDLQDAIGFIDDSEILGGIIGSKADHHAAPYSLTEEFVAVYRMHPLMPDEIVFRSLATGRARDAHARRMSRQAHARRSPNASRCRISSTRSASRIRAPSRSTTIRRRCRTCGATMASGWIWRRWTSSATANAACRATTSSGELFHKDPVKSFDELTDNPAWRKQIKEVYNGDLDKVDLMTGLYAEPMPEGFGFSETAFRVFILMASRRLKSDRFFTDDWRPEGLHGVRARLRQEELDADGAEASLPAACAGAGGREERIRALEANHGSF